MVIGSSIASDNAAANGSQRRIRVDVSLRSKLVFEVWTLRKSDEIPMISSALAGANAVIDKLQPHYQSCFRQRISPGRQTVLAGRS
ncbi:MAG: hypothetical protein JWM11_2299 [Planctomycetaceae bacterium]|nr:hypothetical protein [Planctomycetaceae bacterium]